MFKWIKRAYTKHLNGLVEKYWQIYHFDMNPNHQSYNNEVGREIGKQYFWLIWDKLFNRNKVYDSIAEDIMAKMRAGELITEV